MHSDSDTRWMTRALELAARGRQGVSPNPMVGAVILDQDGRLAGEGYHQRFGAAHAEVEALIAAGPRAAGGTLFVTLEPCAHHGKTPPCVKAIINAGLSRVVVALRDPNPLAAGGIEQLLDAGVDVNIGPGTDSARQLNRRWLRWAGEGRPWITIKAATSLDGRIATRAGESKWITGEEARQRGHGLREEHDAILVGVGTVLADDPSLARHLNLDPQRPWLRVVLDSKLRTPTSARVVTETPEQTLIVCLPEAPEQAARALGEAGVRIMKVQAADDRPDLNDLLKRLAEESISALLVEGGATVHGSFVDAGLVDEAAFFMAPKIFGGPAPAAVAGTGVAHLVDALSLRFEGVTQHGEDLEIQAVRPEVVDVHRAD